jgi:hypothetical protein
MLMYDDFAALGTYLHSLSQNTYQQFLILYERIRQLH